MGSFKIFIAEDDKWYAKALQHHLSLNKDYEVVCYHSGKEILDALYLKPQVITVDYKLPDMNGGTLLKEIKKHAPQIEVIIISGQENISTAMDLLGQGAYDYVVKNTETKLKVWNKILKIKENYLLKKQVESLQTKVANKYKSENLLIGKSAGIHQVHQIIEKASSSSITVSISGNTGTGKELVAKAIHYNSKRHMEPFIAINVASIPSELIESELFGHEKGAFTGAHIRRTGKFELAKSGTIFLDEIGEMDNLMQSKLLRVLQEMELCRIGGNQSIKLKCRIITATHKNLYNEVKLGNFREDLYYRLLGLPICLPTLKSREGDISHLSLYFLGNYCKENSIDRKFSSGALKRLNSYSYPGNVRELKSVIELAAILSDDELIDENHICFQEKNIDSNFWNEEKNMKSLEKEIIRHYLDKCNYNVIVAAKKLEIGKSTIYRLIKDDPIFFKHRTYSVQNTIPKIN